jgi:hypothetical protein
MSVVAAQVGRSAATPLRKRLDLAGINRNYCVAGFLCVAAAVVFVVLSVLVTCYSAADCPPGQEEAVSCNCGKFKWIMGPGLFGVAGAITVYELCTGEGRREMIASQPAATQSLLAAAGAE